MAPSELARSVRLRADVGWVAVILSMPYKRGPEARKVTRVGQNFLGEGGFLTASHPRRVFWARLRRVLVAP